jgi:hypothetical protein
MSITDYLLSFLLIALVVRQIRGRRLTVLGLLWPFGIVVYFATQYLHGIPTAGNDLVLTIAGITVGLVLGTVCGVFTSVRPDADGTPFAKAGALAAAVWILGVGSRLAFQLYATHGGGSSIVRFSNSHDITTVAAWTSALILMAFAEVLGRTAVLAWRARPFWSTARAAAAPSHSTVASGIMETSERAF